MNPSTNSGERKILGKVLNIRNFRYSYKIKVTLLVKKKRKKLHYLSLNDMFTFTC